jgi:HD-GYP domain-containing protein (c-di-GMP phosphodiesterase class II)
MGGDEFAILLPKTEAKEVEKIVDRVRRELSKEKIAAIKCSMSLGYDIKTTIDQDIEMILKTAEDIMYKEKIFAREAINTNMISTITETLYDKCSYEKQHSINVSRICKKIGKALNLSETEVKRLEEAGRLHDIGKIVLDPQILNKNEKLTDEELIKFQQHVAVGYRILNLFDDTLDLAESVLHHHERWDGTGYPKGLKGEEIPIMARIIGLADRYDEMTIGMFEEKPKSQSKVIEEIVNQSGGQFDPQIVDIFLNMIKDEK